MGRWHPDGTLAIIDRKKNIFKLSQGEYVAYVNHFILFFKEIFLVLVLTLLVSAEKLEGIFQRSKYIQQIFVHGDSFEDHLVGIVVPEPDFLASWAAENLPKKVIFLPPTSYLNTCSYSHSPPPLSYFHRKRKEVWLFCASIRRCIS